MHLVRYFRIFEVDFRCSIKFHICIFIDRYIHLYIHIYIYIPTYLYIGSFDYVVVGYRFIALLVFSWHLWSLTFIIYAQYICTHNYTHTHTCTYIIYINTYLFIYDYILSDRFGLRTAFDFRSHPSSLLINPQIKQNGKCVNYRNAVHASLSRENTIINVFIGIWVTMTASSIIAAVTLTEKTKPYAPQTLPPALSPPPLRSPSTLNPSIG